MPKNVMKISKPSPDLARNDFDLSHRFVVSEDFGELLPVLSLETVPGDYFEISASNLIRAIPMVASPFLRAKQHIDLWFVPFSDLWHNFNQFLVQRKDPLSSALHDYQFCPHANLKTIVQSIEIITTDIVNRSYSDGAEKIFNLLGYGDCTEIMQQSAYTGSGSYPDVNLWRVLAYNKIWYDEYRNKYYDDGDHLLGGVLDASYLYSVDDKTCTSKANALVDNTSDRLTAMFQMRYRQWKKDLFTGALPSTQFGVVSAVDSQGFVKFTDSSTFSGWTSPEFTRENPITNDLLARNPNTPSTTSKFFVNGTFDVLALRKSEAIQKWRQIALLSGNSVYDNIRGHYGVIPDHDRDHRPTYIGSVDAVLNIGDINAQSQTGTGANQTLGDVAGKALSSIENKVFKFKANDFGIIMALHSVLPEAEYNAFGLDKNNSLLLTDDYFKPEYQNLGLEAIPSYEFLVEDTTSLSVLGYAPRYFGYKQKLDKVSSAFKMNANPLQNGQFYNWTTPKYDILSTLGGVRPLAGLYVNPILYDHIFAARLALSEQFMNDQYFEIKAVRPMSELGLPQF